MGVNGIYGLSGSGLDVESMVKVGMLSKQNELDKMQQKYTLNEWKKSEYLDLYGEVQTFNNSTLSQYKLSSTMNARSAKSSNETAVSATANGNAAPMNHFVEVGQLASAAYLIGTQSVTRIGGTNAASTELQNSLFSSLTKNVNSGKYTYTDSLGNTGTANASDVAFSFRIGDGSKTNLKLTSTNENVFSVAILNSDTATENVSVTATAATPATLTSASGNSVTQSAKDFFRTLFMASTDTVTGFDSRIDNLLKSVDSSTTAFSFEIKDVYSYTNSNGSTVNTETAPTTVSFTYADLADDTTSFLSKVQSKLQTSNFTARADADGQLLIENKFAGEGHTVNLSITADTTNFALGNNASALSSVAVLETSDIGLTNATPALTAFTQILSGGSNTEIFEAAIKKYSSANEDDAAFTIKLGYTNNSSPPNTEVELGFTFKEIADTSTSFLQTIQKKIDDTLGGSVDEANKPTVSIVDGKLVLSTPNSGTDSKIELKLFDGSVNLSNSDYPIEGLGIENTSAPALIKKNIASFFNGSTVELDTNGNYTKTDNGDDGTGYNTDYFAGKLANFLTGKTITADSNNIYSDTASGTNGTATINGTAYTLDSTNNNVVTAEGMRFTFKGNGAGLANINNADEEITVTYEQLANGFTFNDLVSEINSLGLNVRATYDSVQDRFSIYNKESGIDNSIMLGFGDSTTSNTTLNAAIDRTADFFNQMGLSQTENGSIVSTAEFAAGQTTIIQGKNAIAKIDGIDYTDLSKNNVTVNGVTYTFNAVTNSNIDSDNKIVSSDNVSKVTVNVTQDTDAIAAKVKSFVEEYNAIMKKLYTWYDEKPNEKYKPLTASQKEGMKDEQIEKWEEKAKAGMLYHDKTLFSIINQMRSVISEKVEGIPGNYNTIFSLGISTTGTKGQLTIDEEKLNAALANDPDAVYNIFSKLDKGETQYLVEVGEKTVWTTNISLGKIVYDSDGKARTKTTERSAYNGVVQRLSDILNTGLKNLKTVAGSSADITEDSDLNNLLRELQTKMSNFQRMMQAFETRLYKKYDAMESSLALLGAQLNYVTGAFQ